MILSRLAPSLQLNAQGVKASRHMTSPIIYRVTVIDLPVRTSPWLFAQTRRTGLRKSSPLKIPSLEEYEPV
jgi:hypothetical protein